MHHRFYQRQIVAFAFVIFAVMTGQGVSAAIIGVDADSFVQGTRIEYVDANYGSGSVLQVKYDLSGGNRYHRKAYFRFDVGSVPAAGYDNATLNFTVDTHAAEAGSGTNWNFSVYGLVDGHTGENWGENTITWNNAPANDSAGNSVKLGEVFNGSALATFSLVEGGVNGSTVSLDTTAFPDLLDFLNSDMDGLMTFILVRDTQATDSPNPKWDVVHEFRSKENMAGGAATLTFQIAPEPGSVAIWTGIGVACCALLRWRSGRQPRCHMRS